MNRKRGLIVAATGGVIAVALLLSGLAHPRLQTAIVRGVLAQQPQFTSSLGGVVIRPGVVEVTDLVVQRGSLVLRVPAARAELSLWSFLGPTPRIDRLEATGWQVQWDDHQVVLTAPPATAVAAAGWGGAWSVIDPAELEVSGVLDPLSALLATPVDLLLGEVDLRGEAAWRDAGPGADGEATVEITGTGLNEKGESDLQLMVSARGSAVDAAGFQSLEIRTALDAQWGEDRRLAFAKLHTRLQAGRSGRELRNRYELDLEIDQTQPVLRWRVGLSAENEPLFSADLAAAPTGESLSGEWALAMDDDALRQLMLGRPMPSFQLEGTGQLQASRQLDDVAVQGEVQFTLDQMAEIARPLAGIGEIGGQLSFGIRQAGTDIRFTSLALDLQEDAPVLQARLLQGVEFGQAWEEFRVAQPDAPVFEVDLQGLPLHWLHPVTAPWVIEARPVEGRLVGMVTPRGLQFMTNQPVRVEGAALAGAARTLVDNMDIEMDFGAEVTTEGWQVELARLEVMGEQGSMLKMQARGGRLQRDEDVIKLVGRMDADLGRLNAEPDMTAEAALRQGIVETEFAIGWQDRLSVATTVAVRELETGAGVKLPDMVWDGRADWLEDGTFELHLPVQIKQEQRVSELTLNLRGEPRSAGWGIEGSLSGPVVHVEDLQAVAALGAVGSFAPHRASGPATGDSPSAPWSGVAARMRLAIGQLILPQFLNLRAVQADLLVTDDRLEISAFHATTDQTGQLEGQGRLDFRPEGETKYEGSADLNLTGVDVAPLLRTLQSGPIPVMEGLVAAQLNWRSQADDLRQVVEQGWFTADLASDSGVLRVLGVDIDRYIDTGNTIATLGAIFGAISGNQSMQEQAALVQSATMVAEELAAVSFDQLKLSLEHRLGGDILIEDLALISPNLRMLGEGRISHRTGYPFWMQPLQLKLSLSTRDQLGEALQRLGLRKEKADSLGYHPLVTDLTLTGSLADIGTAELERLLVRALSSRR